MMGFDPGKLVGGIVGTIFGGPVGGAIGREVGDAFGEAIDSDPKPVKEAAAPKPAIKSLTIWFNLLFSLGLALLTWAAGYQWEDLLSPTTAVMIQGGANILLRLASFAPIGANR